MANEQWTSYLLEQVRQLPIASSKQQVQFRLNTITSESLRQNQSIPPQFEFIFQRFLYSRSGRLIESINLFFDAITFAQQNKQEFLICFCHYNIGTIYGMLGNYFYAHKFLTKAEKSNPIGDDYIIGLIKNNIGDIFLQLGNFNEALTHFEEATLLLQQHAHKLSAATSQFNIAEIKAKQCHFDEALNILDNLFDDIKEEPRLLGFYYKIKAEIANGHNNIDEAGAFHLLSIENMCRCQNNYYQAEMILEYCQYLTSHHKYETLDAYIESGLSIAKSIESDKLIDGFNDIILLRIKDIPAIEIREQHYQTLTSSLLNSRRELLKRESDYLQQLYRLNTAKLQLSTMKSLSDNLALVNKIGQYINNSTDLQSILPTIQQDLSTLFQTDTLALGFYDKKADSISIHYLDENHTPKAPYVVNCKSEATYMSYCIKSDSAFYFNHMNSEQKVTMLGDKCDKKVHFKSVMFSPIKINGEIQAGFTVQAKESYQYQAFHFELFTQLINYISIALENQYNRQQLLYLSQTDHLTQVWNRKSLDAHFLQLKKQPSNAYTSIMIDIDHYKEYNDTYGHIAGDNVLINISKLIKEHFHCLNTEVYRYGGDEFFILIADINKEKTQGKLHSLLKAIKYLFIPHEKSTCSHYVSASIGISYIEEGLNTLTLSQVVDRADKALYKAKEMGRDCYYDFSHTEALIQ
ncbi:diguanylate cyclase [Aliivibrio sp. S4TY2]|uniref:tetratricopeptide repeat-containing diguanylate cyclase n=1 Tax=unclassified Aliivibrio TaxID=2645654 RepID=UPI002378F6A2|nr:MULTISPECIES: tetratricopeptide repeat-containing diguanylate cyclase [unclassified Aliivibrio]MDD9156955.1 diguanylate cyclase [Aliivibrio sp. S4TY2]MDD9160831.1 diguanylate cyclase [Aliivibrio sp. S4TY1]MDD9164860.1 diguanylate cyclase [Aliivibrio sp. S4MY2]MDD9168865.1 diguanylate cyclase [Aliivibrio sp. S4MY4]MDD9185393.1 diguanylate cyclase [Aliivibrio sp. S4MY3]